MASPTDIIAATGKRKTAIARVRLQLGAGAILVNGRPMEEYFPRSGDQIGIRKHLILATVHELEHGGAHAPSIATIKLGLCSLAKVLEHAHESLEGLFRLVDDPFNIGRYDDFRAAAEC